MERAKSSLFTRIIFYKKNNWERTFYSLQKSDMVGFDGKRSISFEDETKRNSDVIVEIFELFFEFIVGSNI